MSQGIWEKSHKELGRNPTRNLGEIPQGTGEKCHTHVLHKKDARLGVFNQKEGQQKLSLNISITFFWNLLVFFGHELEKSQGEKQGMQIPNFLLCGALGEGRRENFFPQFSPLEYIKYKCKII